MKMIMMAFQWFDNDSPESAPFPGDYEKSLTDFQRLMLLRCFRVDRIYRAVTEYVTKIMGKSHIEVYPLFRAIKI